MRRVKRALAWFTVVGAIVALALGAMFYRELNWAKGMVPKLDQLTEDLAASPTVIVSADGVVLFRAQAEYRKPAKFEEIPKYLRDATLAAEDERFYDHDGIDYRGLLRAAFVNVRDARSSQGGSTITMQLAKRVYTGPERSFSRKIKDMALAVQIEKSRTKDQILTMYMNQAYYGAGAYGVGAAASVYFNKSLSDLTLGECALLARLVRRPSVENPFENLERAIENRDIVLDKMLESEMITRKEYDAARAEKVKLAHRNFGSGARTLASPYFVDYVLDFVKQELPDSDIMKGGFRIETTLDTRLDNLAQEQVRQIVEANRKQNITTGAFVLMDSEGRIKAMVGGVDHSRNSYNAIYQGGRQPGSSFKPFVYATGLASGILTPSSQISNEQLVIDDPQKGKHRWPKNGNGMYGGTKSIASALAGSVNVCAVRACETIGPDRVANFARDIFGIKSPLDPVLALALGSSAVKPLEMAQGYSVFMLRGDRATPFGVTKIIGPSGEVFAEYEPNIQRGMLDREVADRMDGYLRGVVTRGTGTRALSVPYARGKTGTTSDHRDAWFCGYTNTLVGIGWVCNERREGGKWVYDPMNRVFGGRVTIQIWTGVMKEAAKFYKEQEEAAQKTRPKSPPPPPKEDEIPIDDVGGQDPVVADPNGPGTGETEPPIVGEEHTIPPDSLPPPVSPTAPRGNSGRPLSGRDAEIILVEICSESGQLSNPYCPETVTRTLQRGRAPTVRCQLHGPS